jgi:hypothetical protein
LTREIMTVEAEDNYAGAGEMLKRLAVLRPEVEATLARLKNVPVDIEPRFVTAEALGARK